MKPAKLILFTLCFFLFAANIQAQVNYPRFQKHTVLDGETAQTIVDKFHVALQDFCLLNDFPERVRLMPGQVVLVKQLADGEEEIVEEVPGKKVTPVKSAPAKAEAKEEPVKKEAAAKEEPAKTETTEETPLKKTTPVKSEPAKTVSEDKPKPAPAKAAAAPVAEKSAPVAKKQAAEEPFVVPPPSTKAIEIGPHGTVYHVSKGEYHVVEKNQTFFRIALIYGMSVDELKELNGIENTTVEIGQRLKVRK